MWLIKCSLDNPDTETIYTVVTQNILDIYKPGAIYTMEQKVPLMGLQTEAVARKIVELFDLPLTWQEYAELAKEQITLLMPKCRIMPGIVSDKALLICRFLFFLFSFFASMKCLNSNRQHH